MLAKYTIDGEKVETAMIKVKVGDEIGVTRYCGRVDPSGIVAIVKKISKTGQITLEDGMKFDSQGNECLGTSDFVYRHYLMDADELRHSMQQQDERRGANRAIRRVVDEFVHIIAEHKNHAGDVLMSEKTRAELVALVQTLPITTTP